MTIHRCILMILPLLGRRGRTEWLCVFDLGQCARVKSVVWTGTEISLDLVSRLASAIFFPRYFQCSKIKRRRENQRPAVLDRFYRGELGVSVPLFRGFR